MTDAVVLTDPRTFAETFGDQIAAMVQAYGDGMAPTVASMPARMWSVFTAQTGEWAPRPRHELLSRFVGFPLWDALIFPTIALAPVPQFTPIGVTRFSPLDAHRFDSDDRGPKLEGVAWHHFGGFLDTAYRENDYLWGRLDGAELCLGTLRGGAHNQPSGAHGDPGVHLDQALRAIVAAERDLTHVPQLRARILARLQAPPNPTRHQPPEPDSKPNAEHADAG